MEQIKYISNDLSEEIKNIKKVIEETFGIKLTIIQASRIVAWKSQRYKINLTSQKLGEILLRKKW